MPVSASCAAECSSWRKRNLQLALKSQFAGLFHGHLPEEDSSKTMLATPRAVLRRALHRWNGYFTISPLSQPVHLPIFLSI